MDSSIPFVPQQPEHITLHHEGVIFDGSLPAPDYLRAIQHWVITSVGWPDIPYHFIIDLDGIIYEGRPLDARGDTHTSYDLQNMAQIAVLGKYDEGEQVPDERQIDAIIDIMTWLAFEYHIPPDAEHIKGHRDYIPVDSATGLHIDPMTGESITCPGDNLYVYLPSIINEVADRLASMR
ncbi:MAG: N-acetylmuramoyl-L-alanine amidase [Chloroflexaceae bacterium]|nr:N-acetylmuramoyl-L-alanine amidase [Chloroflexaceae bacterium]